MSENLFLMHMVVVLYLQVYESGEREEGWLYGSSEGKLGWFPESYVEKQSKPETPGAKTALKPQLLRSMSRYYSV